VKKKGREGGGGKELLFLVDETQAPCDLEGKKKKKNPLPSQPFTREGRGGRKMTWQITTARHDSCGGRGGEKRRKTSAHRASRALIVLEKKGGEWRGEGERAFQTWMSASCRD